MSIQKKTLSRLQALESKVLAEALFSLAQDSGEALALVNRLTRTSDESYKSCKRAISGLKRSSAFIDWHAMGTFARKLENIVTDIEELDTSVEQRFELICAFLETDEATFNRCDDSNGYVGDVYRDTALSVFEKAAANLNNQPLLAETLERLLLENNYGIRDRVLEVSIMQLDEDKQRQLFSRFEHLSDAEENEYQSREWLHHSMDIANSLGDCKLFELTALESVAHMDEVPIVTKYEIASMYFDNNDVDTAKAWMDDIDAEHRFMRSERNQLLMAIHDRLGDTQVRDDIARREFNAAPSSSSLSKLLSIIGEEHCENVIAEHIEKIANEPAFSDSSLDFLMDTVTLEIAAQYVIDKRETINGDYYWNLPKQAARLADGNHWAAAVCINRALLDSILSRGKTVTYNHGVKYLILLDELSQHELPDDMLDHVLYKAGLIEQHGRKHSFWSKYDAKAGR